MINIRTLRKLNNNDGLTLKNGKIVNYKTGYQVATEGVEIADIKDVHKALKNYEGNCGIWYSEGIYYIDKSHRVNTKKAALALGRECNQLSILKWSDKSLIWC